MHIFLYTRTIGFRKPNWIFLYVTSVKKHIFGQVFFQENIGYCKI